jgi:hypothetical protein
MRNTLIIDSPPFYIMFCSTNLSSAKWQWKNCSDVTGRRVLFAVWIAIVGWRLRGFWEWKADSEDNECSCYDVTPIDGAECWVSEFRCLFSRRCDFRQLKTLFKLLFEAQLSYSLYSVELMPGVIEVSMFKFLFPEIPNEIGRSCLWQFKDMFRCRASFNVNVNQLGMGLRNVLFMTNILSERR